MSGVGCLGVCLLRKRRDQQGGEASHGEGEAEKQDKGVDPHPFVGFFLGKVSGFFLFHVAANGPHGGHKKAYPYGEHDLGDGRRKHIRMIVHEPEHGGPPLFAGRPLSGLGIRYAALVPSARRLRKRRPSGMSSCPVLSRFPRPPRIESPGAFR